MELNRCVYEVLKEKRMKRLLVFCGGLIALAIVAPAQNEPASVEAQRTLVNQYCAGCHNANLKSGGFSFTDVDLPHPEQTAERAEKVIRKLRAGMMPPPGAKRPDGAALKALASGLESRIDLA